METAIVLVSGGLDSCVTAAIAAENHTLAFLHVNYGQRTEEREMRAFTDIADHYNVTTRLSVDIKYLAAIGGSSLTDESMDVEEGDLDREGVPSTYVPFRNGNILSIAASWAEVIGAKKIFIGAVEEDSSGYPDCRQTFYDAFNHLLQVGTHPDTDVRIETPLIRLKKPEIVARGLALDAPLSKTWSCYTASERACGVCDSCLLRLRGFKQAGTPDPIDYETIPENLRI